VATVPFSGVPEREPQFRPTPDVGIAATPAAFGVNVAQAVGHLGEVQEGAGKELFGRAIAFQELDQHAAANAGIAEFQNQTIKKEIDFYNLEGKAAKDGIDPFLKDLDASRDQIGQSMPSPYAKFLYDQESRQSRFRSAWYAGMHAANQFKRYQIGAADAGIKAAQDSIELNPDDKAGVAAQIKVIEDRENSKADLAGLSPEERHQKTFDAVSTAVIGQIQGFARKGDPRAVTLLNEAIAEKRIAGSRVAGVQAFVENQLGTVGARHGASEVMTGENLQWGTGKLSDAALLNGLKSSEGGYYGFRGPTVTDKSGHKGQALGHFGVMSYNLQGFLRDAGMPAMTEDEFLHNPTAQDQLALFKMKDYQNRFGSANRAAMAWFGGEGSAYVQPGSIADKNMNGLTYLKNFNHGAAHGATLDEKVAQGNSWADSHMPGDDYLRERLSQQIETLHNNDLRIRKDTEFNNEQSIWGGMVNGVGAGNKIPTTVDELTADPTVKEAWDWMSRNEPSKLKRVLDTLAKNAKGDVAMNDVRLSEWQRLAGMSVKDPEKFMEETQDLSKVDLPLRYKGQIIQWQRQIYRQQDAAPAVSHALQRMGPALRAAGFVKGQDEEGLYKFTGALHDAMQEFLERHDKQMNDTEIEEAGGRLLQEQASGFFGMSSTHFIEGGVPNEEAAKLRAIKPDVTEEEIARAYFAAQALKAVESYQNLFGKKGPK